MFLKYLFPRYQKNSDISVDSQGGVLSEARKQPLPIIPKRTKIYLIGGKYELRSVHKKAL